MTQSLTATTPRLSTLDLGATWVIEVEAEGAVVTAEIVEPSAASLAMAQVGKTWTGHFAIVVEGRHTARVQAVKGGVTEVITFAAVGVGMGLPPTADEVAEYLGQGAPETSVIESALAAETAAQANACTSGGRFPDDLAEALKRRVARNLAMRGAALGIYSDAEVATRISSLDPEIRRLEGPYRKRVVG